MTSRRRERAVWIVVLAAIAAAATILALAPTGAKGQAMPHAEYHPQWLRDSGCCGAADCYRARVRFTPAGWQVLAMRLRPTDPWRPPPFPIAIAPETASPSQDRHFWVCFHMKKGQPVRLRHRGTPPRLCFFAPNSGQ